MIRTLPLKYSIITFGCRVNQADSLAIARDLRSRGAVESTPQDAELVVVNTCSVTAAADQGVRQTVRRVVRDNPDVRVIVTGCYATRRPDEIRELRPFKASAMYLSLQCWTADTEKMYELGCVQADEFLRAASNQDEYRPEWLAVRFYGAIAHKKFADTKPKDAKGEDAKARDQSYEKAAEYAGFVANVSNEYQNQARALLREITGSDACAVPASAAFTTSSWTFVIRSMIGASL